MQVPECVLAYCGKPDKFVFKKCRENRQTKEFLVVLEKPDYVDDKGTPFACNEFRKGIIDICFAKFRCNGLVPRLIVDLQEDKLHESVLHFTYLCATKTEYKVGHLVSPSSFNPNLQEICGEGIHYFLSARAAMSYNFSSGSCFGSSLSGPYEYRADGSLCRFTNNL